MSITQILELVRSKNIQQFESIYPPLQSVSLGEKINCFHYQSIFPSIYMIQQGGEGQS